MTASVFAIDGREIGPGHRPYLIAEMSANHNGRLETALAILEAAKSAGADALKLQTYTPDTITLDCNNEEFLIKGGLWKGRTLHDLYQEAHMPWDWHKPLFERGRELGLTVFSSPFDDTAVDLLEGLGAPAYKIASLEIVDLPLIRQVASTGKPMIMSTGLADADEIAEAVQAARDGGCEHLVLLHCVTGYPAPAADYNLRTIPDMIQRFGVHVGLSDHTLDNTTAFASVALGAVAVEKHFTLDRRGGGPDDSFSLEPADLGALRRGLDTAWESLGRIDYGIKPSEAGNLIYRPSIYVSQDVKAGDPVTAENVRTVRPGLGLHPRYLDEVIGRTFLHDVQFGTPLSWPLISGPSKEAP